MFDADPEVLAAFSEESSQRLADLERGLLTLEARPQGQENGLLHAMFRDAHSLKAGANLLDLAPVERAAHRLENVLDLLRSGRLAAGSEVCQALLDGVDLLRESLTPGQTPEEDDPRALALAALAAGR